MDEIRRADDLPPEFCQYRDEGCEVEPSCLACSLPQCVYETPRKARRLKHRQRDDTLRRAYRSGEPAPALAERFHVSRRTVYRIIGEGASSARTKEGEI